MPCYQVNTISVEFPAEDFELLAKAAEVLQMPFEISGNTFIVQTNYGPVSISEGKATGSSLAIGDVNRLRVQYSTEGVRKLSKQFGWSVQQIKPNEYIAAKR